MSQGTDQATSGETTVQPHEGGYVAHGPGFYAWDEDPAEVWRAVRDLERGWLDAPPTRRFLLIKPNEPVYDTEPGGRDPRPQ